MVSRETTWAIRFHVEHRFCCIAAFLDFTPRVVRLGRCCGRLLCHRARACRADVRSPYRPARPLAGPDRLLGRLSVRAFRAREHLGPRRARLDDERVTRGSGYRAGRRRGDARAPARGGGARRGSNGRARRGGRRALCAKPLAFRAYGRAAPQAPAAAARPAWRRARRASAARPSTAPHRYE